MMERKIKQSKIFLLAILFAVGILAAWVLTFSPASAHAASGIEWGNGGTVEGRTITIDNSESYGVMATAGDKEYAYNVFDFDMTLDLKADDGYAMFELRVAGGGGLRIEMHASMLVLRAGDLSTGKNIQIPAPVLKLKDNKEKRNVRITIDDDSDLLSVVFDNDPVLKRFDIAADSDIAAAGKMQFLVNKAKITLEDFRAYTVEHIGRKAAQGFTFTEHNNGNGNIVITEDSLNYGKITDSAGQPPAVFTDTLKADEYLFDIAFTGNVGGDWMAYQFFRCVDGQQPLWGAPGNGAVGLVWQGNDNVQFYYIHGSIVKKARNISVNDYSLYDGKPHSVQIMMNDDARTAAISFDGVKAAEIAFDDYVTAGLLTESDYRTSGSFSAQFGQPCTIKLEHLEFYDAYDGYKDYIKQDNFFWRTNYFVAGNDLWAGCDDDNTLWNSVRQTAGNIYYASSEGVGFSYNGGNHAAAKKDYASDVVRFDFAGIVPDTEKQHYFIMGMFTESENNYGDAIGYFLEMNSSRTAIFANGESGKQKLADVAYFNFFDGKNHSFFFQRNELTGKATLRIDALNEYTFDIPEGLKAANGGLFARGYNVCANVSNTSVYQSVIPVTSITVKTPEVFLALDSETTHNIEAEVLPADATFTDLEYEVTAGDGIVTVNESGLITAVSSGTATVRVFSQKYPEIGYDVTVTVAENEVALTGIEIETELKLEKGKTHTFTPVFTPADATFRKVNYEVTGDGATVDENGVLTATAGSGSVTVTVTSAIDKYSEVSATCEVTLIPLQPTGIEFAYGISSVIMEAGDELQISANALPVEVENQTFTYVSADESVATVDTDGKITAVAAGNTHITVVSNVKDKGEVSVRFDVRVVRAKESAKSSYNLAEIEELTPNLWNNTGDDKNSIEITEDLKAFSVKNYGPGQPSVFTQAGNLTADYIKFDLRLVMSSSMNDWACGVWFRTSSPGTAFFSAQEGFGLLFMANGIQVSAYSSGMLTVIGNIGASAVNYLNGDAHTYEIMIDDKHSLLRVSIDGKQAFVFSIPADCKTEGGLQFIANSNNSPRPTEFYVRNLYVAEIAEKLAPQDISFTETEKSVRRGESFNLTIQGVESTDNIVYTSSSSAVKVSENGLVTVERIPSSNVIITAYLYGWEGYAAKMSLKVLPPVAEQIALNKQNIFLGKGESSSLIALLQPSDSEGAIIFESENEEIATVDSAGNVSAVGVGSTRIKVSIDGADIAVYCNVTVTEETVTVTENKTNLLLAIGIPALVLIAGAAVIVILKIKKIL